MAKSIGDVVRQCSFFMLIKKGRVAMSNKALTNGELELTQKIQTHFPRGISPELIASWNGCPKELLMARLTDIFSQPPEEAKTTSFLRLISGDKALVIDAVDGTEILADANDVFKYIDGDFKNWGADEKGPATKETPVNVHEMVKDGTFAEMFSSLNPDVEKLFFTHHQIKNFVQKKSDWLRTDGYATFFTFKSKGERFVAYVDFGSDDRLRVYVYRFVHDDRWSAGSRHRIVVPQLAES